MYQCQNKIALITGASAGIGFASAAAFAAAGANLVLCARRLDPLERLRDQLVADHGVRVSVFALDVSDAQGVAQVLSTLLAEHTIDILVNNAGLALGVDRLDEAQVADWDQMIDVNIKGLLYVTRQVLQQMRQRSSGHVINVGSISSRQVYSGGAVYCATKFAVRAITEGLKMDVHGTPIRTTLINPGLVETEFSMTRFSGNQTQAAAVYAGMTPLRAADIADAILYAATRPLHVDVREITLLPTAQTAAHLCHRDEDSLS
jgi:NADP-dependent 3-hydroxy acid dehydrogenase YdfG